MKNTSAEQWASSVWDRNLSGWENRNQDYNYRKLLARPGMQKILGKIPRIQGGIFLDLGCGDGSEMCHINKKLFRDKNSGKFFGFDLQENLVRIARKRFKKNSSIDYSFDHGSLDDLVRKHRLIGKVDRIFSTFLLQELSDAKSHLQMISQCLKKDGYGIFLLLHPFFGTAMFSKNAIKINEELQSDDFEWAGEYPIVEENGKTFYVPYFHRSRKCLLSRNY